MADQRFRLSSRISKIRVESSKLIRSDDLATKIENMYPTEEGTLRAIWGPAPYLPNFTTGGAPASGAIASIGTLPAGPTYGATKGIFHARLAGGQKDVLLLHTGDQIWVFEGWKRQWKRLIQEAFGEIRVALEDNTRPQFPTQFVATPTGIVIIPQNRRAYFYDGTVILPLGYSSRPGSPAALGPENSDSKQASGVSFLPGMNDVRYAHDALPHRLSGMNKVFGKCRIGLAVHPTNYNVSYNSGGQDGDTRSVTMGWLEPGLWRTRVQWIDRWGNLSPISEPSEDIEVSRQVATGLDDFPSPAAQEYCHPDLALKQFAWEGIVPGPTGTLGRILYRTKDLKQSGDSRYYEIPLNAHSAGNAFATLPDNVSQMYPDNIPDAWLIREMVEVDPVPEFKLATMAFGRLWIANIPGAPGMVKPSEVGLWGTFPSGKEFYPDPSGAEITGLHAVPQGMLVFTETSTYLVEANLQGTGFKSMPLSTRSGCVAPGSIATIRNGVVIWLGRDGFYAYDGNEPQYIFEDKRTEVREWTKARLRQAVSVFDERSNQYRCWVSVQGSRFNTRCYTFDGEGWNRRTDVAASGATVTKDHRRYVILSGRDGTTDGVWVQDVAQAKHIPAARNYIVETGWISSEDSKSRKSLKRISIWMREARTSGGLITSKLQVEVMRDWRETIDQTGLAEKYRLSGVAPEFWGIAQLDATDAKWRGRRPFFTKVDVSIPSCEVFKIRFTSVDSWEFIGMQFDIEPRDTGGANIPP